MNELERFKAVINFEEPDFWPLIISADGLGFAHASAMQRLHEEGMPKAVNDYDSWCKYWGQFCYDVVGSIGVGASGIKSRKWIENEFEYTEYETGALERQLRTDSPVYSMPEFMEFHVRDHASWEKYKKLTAPQSRDFSKIDYMKHKYGNRQRPLSIFAGGTWGRVRDLMGPEKGLLAIYDSPDLVHEIISYMLQSREELVFPVIEALRPEIITLYEDCCYKNGMLISPDSFREFCAPYYRRVAEFARECGAELMIVDSDGNIDEFCGLLEEFGFNGCWPVEQAAGNNLLKLREAHPEMIFAGGIEKEVVNTGSRREIDSELYPKIPEMLKRKGYFLMFDHVLQPEASFHKLRRCMTRLHEICGSNLGEFPRC